MCTLHDDVIKWKHFPRYWPFVWGIHRSPVNSPHKGQWRGALMFSLICINGWVNNGEAGDLRRHRSHYDVIVMDNCLMVRTNQSKRFLLWVENLLWNWTWIVYWQAGYIFMLTQTMIPGDAHMRLWIGSSLFQVVACRPLSANPLH